MAYTLNGTALSVYGITPGHSAGSNIALGGCYDMPKRSGKCFHDWGEYDGIEPYVAAGDIFFEGRDITFTGTIIGSNSQIQTYLKALYTAIGLFSDLVDFVTPYGTYSVFVKSITPEMYVGAASIKIIFREPVVTLTGTLPSTGAANYTIDAIPFLSYGLYLSKAEALRDLPEMKSQSFTIYGAEGYQMNKRQNNKLDINGFITGTSLSNFQSNVSALYKCFAAAGTRNIKINNEINVDCFLTDGFTIDNVIYDGSVIAKFNASVICYRVKYLNYLLSSTGDYILTTNGNNIII